MKISDPEISTFVAEIQLPGNGGSVIGMIFTETVC